MASSVKNAASSAAPTSLDHAAQNLRTTSIGLSIWLLLRSILLALGRAPISARPTDDTIPALPVAAAASINVRRETTGAGTPVLFSESIFRIAVVIGPRLELLVDPQRLARGRVCERIANGLRTGPLFAEIAALVIGEQRRAVDGFAL